MTVSVKNTFIHDVDVVDEGEAKRSSSLPPSTRFGSSPRCVHFNSTDAHSGRSGDAMSVRKEQVCVGKSVSMKHLFAPPMPMETPPEILDRNGTKTSSFSEDDSTEASEGDEASEVGKATLADELLQIESSLQYINDALLEIQTMQSILPPVPDPRAKAQLDIQSKQSLLPLVPDPQGNAQTVRGDFNVEDRRKAFIQAPTVKLAGTSAPCSPKSFGVEHLQSPLELAVVLMKVQMMLGNYFSHASVKVIERNCCWFITIQSSPEWQGHAAAFAKETLLKASHETDGVEILGTHTEPFVTTPYGFEATLALVPDKYNACWGLLQKGFCCYGNRCKWQHPIHLREIYVEVKSPRS